MDDLLSTDTAILVLLACCMGRRLVLWLKNGRSMLFKGENPAPENDD